MLALLINYITVCSSEWHQILLHTGTPQQDRMGTFLGTLFKYAFLGIVLLLTVMLIRTLTFPSHQPDVGPCSPDDTDFIKLTDEMTNHFQEAIRIKTVSRTPTDIMLSEILEMHKFLIKSKFMGKSTMQMMSPKETTLSFIWLPSMDWILLLNFQLVWVHHTGFTESDAVSSHSGKFPLLFFKVICRLFSHL